MSLNLNINTENCENKETSILNQLIAAVEIKNQTDLRKIYVDLLEKNNYFIKITLPEVTNVFKVLKTFTTSYEAIRIYKTNKVVKCYVLNIVTQIASETLNDKVIFLKFVFIHLRLFVLILFFIIHFLLVQKKLLFAAQSVD
jgi:hypothetical protein